MTDSKRISGADILAMRSQAAEAENYAIIARANIDRLTRAYAALEIEVVKIQSRLEAVERDAERYRWLASRAHKNTAHDRYGNGAHWSIGFFAHDGRHTLDAAIDAMKEQQP